MQGKGVLFPWSTCHSCIIVNNTMANITAPLGNNEDDTFLCVLLRHILWLIVSFIPPTLSIFPYSVKQPSSRIHLDTNSIIHLYGVLHQCT